MHKVFIDDFVYAPTGKYTFFFLQNLDIECACVLLLGNR